MDKTICYCFEITEKAIKRDVEQNRGQSQILEQILTAKRKKSCLCSTKHPEGR